MPDYSDYSEKLSLRKIKDAFRIFFRFNGYLLRHWKAELTIIAMESAGLALVLLNPYLGKLILDDGILGKNLAVFLKITCLSVSVYLLSQGAEKINLWLKDYAGRRIRVDLARRALKKTSQLSLASFRNSSTSECVSRLNADVAISSSVIAGTLPDLIRVILSIALITIIILFINGRILFLILAYQAVALVQANFFAKKNDRLMNALYEKGNAMSRVLSHVFSHLYFVKASGKMSAMMRKYFHAFADNIRLEAKSARFEFISGILSDISGKIFFGLVGFVGTILVIKGALTLGSLAAIVAYVSQGSGAYTSLINLCQRIIANRLPLERMARLLDAEIEIKEKRGAIGLDLSEGKIEFRSVSFGYSSARRVLDRANFTIMPGDKAALIGLSGCGKTTIVNLILRLYDVNGGAILLNDCDVRNIKLKSIYNQISLAGQSPYISGDTIRNNIAYAGLKLNDSAVARAAGIAQIRSFVEALPDGYDTTLSEMVLPLSQGQKQRIAIARAIAKNPRILILDEACSSLDSQTEEKVIDNILEAFPDITLITVTHRLSTVKKMEKVYFLKSAREVAPSTHAALAESDPAYAELFAGQLEAGIPVTV